MFLLSVFCYLDAVLVRRALCKTTQCRRPFIVLFKCTGTQLMFLLSVFGYLDAVLVRRALLDATQCRRPFIVHTAPFHCAHISAPFHCAHISAPFIYTYISAPFVHHVSICRACRRPIKTGNQFAFVYLSGSFCQTRKTISALILSCLGDHKLSTVD
jgi:hypothetical protein